MRSLASVLTASLLSTLRNTESWRPERLTTFTEGNCPLASDRSTVSPL